MSVVNLKAENLNPFDIAQHYFEQAADRLQLDEGMRASSARVSSSDHPRFHASPTPCSRWSR